MYSVLKNTNINPIIVNEQGHHIALTPGYGDAAKDKQFNAEKIACALTHFHSLRVVVKAHLKLVQAGLKPYRAMTSACTFDTYRTLIAQETALLKLLHDTEKFDV